jgi:hypothetical protein
VTGWIRNRMREAINLYETAAGKFFVNMQGFSFITAPSVAALSHITPECVTTSHHCCSAQDDDERNVL